MNKLVLVLLFAVGVVLGQNVCGVYFNEVRYDDDGSDDCEFLELIGPAGTNLSGMTIVHYNGASSSDGGLIKHTIGDFVIPDDGLVDRKGTALGFFVLALSDDGETCLVENWDELTTKNLQGGPDALALFRCDMLSVDNILDAIGWGDMSGADILDDDPGFLQLDVAAFANNFLHIIPESKDSDESIQNNSLVMNNDGSGWQVGAATPGAINVGQDNGMVELPVELSGFKAVTHANAIILSWQTESEHNNLGFEIFRSQTKDSDYERLASFAEDNNLRGRGTTVQSHVYEFVDDAVEEGVTYWYKLADVDCNGERTMHAAISAMVAQQTDALHKLPSAFCLHPNYPNPFNPSTHFQLDLPHAIQGTLSIYDMLGKHIVTLQKGVFAGGQHFFSWNGVDSYGRDVGSGVYFVIFQSKEYRTAIKSVLAR